jgi:hypothetical protein
MYSKDFKNGRVFLASARGLTTSARLVASIVSNLIFIVRAFRLLSCGNRIRQSFIRNELEHIDGFIYAQWQQPIY